MDATAGRVDATAGRGLRLADLARLGAAVDAVRRASWADLLQVSAEQVRDLLDARSTVLVALGEGDDRDGVRAVAGTPLDGDLPPAVAGAVAAARPVRSADGAMAVPLLGAAGPVAVLLVLPGPGAALDEVDVELADQVCRAAAHRWQDGQDGDGSADDRVLRAALLGSLDEGVMITRGPQQRVTLVSPLLESALAPAGPEGEPTSLGAQGWLDEDGTLRPTADLPTWQAYRTGQPVFGESMRIVPADGPGADGPDLEDAARWVVVSAQPVLDPLTAEVEAVVTRVRDVTGSHRVALQRQEESTDHERTVTEVVERRRQFETAFDAAPYGMLVVSAAPGSLGRVVRVNRALAVLVDRPLEQIDGPVEDVLRAPDDDAVGQLDLANLADAGRDGQRLVRRVVRSDGAVRNVWVTVVPVLDTSVSEPFLVVHVLDVTSQSNQQRTLERIALTDAVTGLGNRSMVTVRVDRALAAQERPLALMMLDLDRFKMVNDSLGHQVGDLLLVAVADRLRELAPPGALVARLGGDEFVVMVQGQDAVGPEPLAAELVRDLGRPYELSSGHRVVSSASVGVAVVSEQQPSRLDLLRDADLALYRAKELGRNRFVVCDDALLARAEARLQDEQRLRDGLDAGRLRLHLQPLHDLATGRLRALEALVRLEDPELGLLGPDRFVPIAEETGLVAEIDHWMVDAALAVIGSDPRFVVDPQLRLAVNMSGRTLQRSDFTARLTEALDRHGTDPHRLALEITETCLLDDDGGTIAMLRGLRTLGITVCIDDFGTGYSALSYLQTFQVDVLKVDRAFVEALSSPGEQARATLTAIITMAHALGLLVVAEGVETVAQRDTLVSLGCDWAQGWHYGHAVPPPRREVVDPDALGTPAPAASG